MTLAEVSTLRLYNQKISTTFGKSPGELVGSMGAMQAQDLIMAKRYFTCHGPATVKDFSWWSGLSISDSKKALEYIKPELISETIDSAQYWFPGPSPDYRPDKDSVFLLPAYDEFLIGYRNRSASLSLTDNPKTVSINGIFRPVIIVNGQVSGLWKRVSTKDKIRIELSFFKPVNKTILSLSDKVAQRFGKFVDKEV